MALYYILVVAVLFAMFIISLMVASLVNKRYKAQYGISLVLAAKHESLMCEAVPLLESFAVLCESKGLSKDAARIKSIANSMKHAVGMAAKLKGALNV